MTRAPHTDIFISCKLLLFPVLFLNKYYLNLNIIFHYGCAKTTEYLSKACATVEPSSRIVLFLPSVATASPLSWESFILSICVSSFTWRYLNCRVVNTVYWLFASRWELIRKAHKTRTVCARGVIYDRVRLLCEWVRGASFLCPFLSFPIIRICTRGVPWKTNQNWTGVSTL